MVAAPRPVAIVEIDAIKALLDNDQLVIACGGGGIPVMEQGSNLKGASAVIEKDLAGALLAKEVDADVLMILTNVDHVSLNYGKSNEAPISSMTVSPVSYTHLLITAQRNVIQNERFKERKEKLCQRQSTLYWGPLRQRTWEEH